MAVGNEERRAKAFTEDRSREVREETIGLFLRMLSRDLESVGDSGRFAVLMEVRCR